MTRIDNKLKILGKKLLYAKLHLYFSFLWLHLLGYIGYSRNESGPGVHPDFNCRDSAPGEQAEMTQSDGEPQGPMGSDASR